MNPPTELAIELLGDEPVSRTDAGAAHRADRRAVAQLSLLEGVRLLRHPAFLLGCALTVAYLLASRDSPNGVYLGLTGGAGMGPGMGLLLAANLATLRARTDETEEVLAAAALEVADRTRALAVASILPAAAATVLTLALGAALSATSGLTVATTTGHRDLWPSAIELTQVPVFVLACGALGIALGRWCPYRLASVVCAVAAFFLVIPTFFWTTQGTLGNLAPLLDHSRVDHWVQVTPGSGHNVVDGFDVARLGWHVVYLSGLALALVGAALGRVSQERLVGRLLAVGAVLALLGGVAQMG